MRRVSQLFGEEEEEERGTKEEFEKTQKDPSAPW